MTKKTLKRWREFMHQDYINIAKAASALSKDTTKIGAVAVDWLNRIVGIGVNGYPPGYDDGDMSNKYDKVIHAEMNAVINSIAIRGQIKAVYIYGLPPCKDCLKFLAAYGVEKIYYTANKDIASIDKWIMQHNIAVKLHNIKVTQC